MKENNNVSKKILGLIPARGDSQRIPNKNIQLLGGKPLIAYTIEAAKSSNYINRVIVTTDSEKIAEIAKQFKAEVPFLRPREISKGDSTEMQFFKHVLDWLEDNESYIPDLIVLLYPTSPFRKSQSIDKAVEEIMKKPEADSLRSIRLCKEHPYKMWIAQGDYLKPFVEAEDPNIHTYSSQLLPTVYIQNASIYITKPSTLREKKSPTGNVIIPFIMDEIESLDINNPIDLKLAEIIKEDLK